MLPFIGNAQKLERFRAANSRPYGSNATCLEIYKHQLIVLTELGGRFPYLTSQLAQRQPPGRTWEKDRKKGYFFIISRFCQKSSKYAKLRRNRPLFDERLFDFRLAKTIALC